MSSFIPRATFPALTSLPRSYFLGHHKSGLSKMKSLLGSIDLIIECRDYRVPITSRNPMFEASLGQKERWIIYTKKDLGSEGGRGDAQKEDIIAKWHHPSKVLFSTHKSKPSLLSILSHLRHHASAAFSLTGHRILVVGMPNVGKSSLLNALRLHGVGKGKAAITGAQPGVTRKIGSSVKIIDGAEEGGEGGGGVYLLDTPGVFVPYVPDAQAMLKLALVGCVKDTVVPVVILADYLLYHLNRVDSMSYAEYHPPTNEIMELLEAIARKTGRLQKGGVPDTEAAALWMVQRWRMGYLGRFLLDEVSEDALEKRRLEEEAAGVSVSQARKIDKDMKRERARKRRDGFA